MAKTKLKPFDPIRAPADDYRGPAQGLSPEHGDSWRGAIEKINAGFAHVYGLIDAGGGAVTADIGDIDKLREEVASLKTQIGGFFSAGTDPVLVAAYDPSLSPSQANDPDGKAATGGAPEPNADGFKAPGAGSD